MLLKVETSADARDYAKYETLREEIWGFPEDNLPGTRNLMCENFLYDGGALFLAVYSQGPGGKLSEDPARFVGFSYGFVGVKDKDVVFKSLDNLQFYSQYTCVKEKFRGYGLGLAIKEFQREVVRDVFGISTITCTYDPLTGVNARRNIHHFGMEVVEYRASTYGEYGGLLNRLDVPSDRFFMSWDLRKKAKRRAFDYEPLLSAERCVIQADEREVRGRSGRARLEIAAGVDLKMNQDTLFVQVPRDFYFMLRETDVGDERVRRIPLDWRLRTRKIFQTFLPTGYRVADFFQTKRDPARNFYVLKFSPRKERRKG